MQEEKREIHTSIGGRRNAKCKMRSEMRITNWEMRIAYEQDSCYSIHKTIHRHPSERVFRYHANKDTRLEYSTVALNYGTNNCQSMTMFLVFSFC